jgi:hypothetical protein
MRQLLTQRPGDQALFVLDLDDGSKPFIANVGHGGYGDNDYMPMGPQPVVKRLPDGKEWSTRSFAPGTPTMRAGTRTSARCCSTARR